jgi:hypothetical protein
MMVRLYLDFDGHWIRGGIIRIRGNSASMKTTMPKAPTHISLNANHDLLVLKKQ